MPGVLTTPGPKLLLSMKTHILNSAMMPAEGYYHLRAISAPAFFQGVVTAYNRNQLKSWIGYEQNAELIKQETGIPVELCREVTEIKHGDDMLIMKLKYRVSTQYKGKPVDPADFDYFRACYMERPPIPAFHDLMSMDIFEPSAQQFIKDLYHFTGGKLWESVERKRIALANTDGIGEEWQKARRDYILALQYHFDFELWRENYWRENS